MQSAYPQYEFQYDTDHLSSVTFGPNQHNGFRISLSLVALFTAGSVDRDGLRWGAGFALSQTIDNWIFSAGVDAYKAKQRFGIGTTFAGITFDDGCYGGTYYLTQYYQGDRQTSGLLHLHLNEVRIGFEDDLLAFPFVGFKIYDRYRTAALQFSYKGFMLGTNVYTTDINGQTDYSAENKNGQYLTGRQISSPIYIGYTSNDLMLRVGWNNLVGGLVGQNSWHRVFFDTPDFHSGNYDNLFLQLGVDKPYTLY